MGDYELVIKRCKALEEILEQGFTAQGRGLHEKVSSVQAKLPEPLVKRLRFIATVRNKLVHETTMDKLDDRAGFERACNDSEVELRSMLQPFIKNKSGCLPMILLGVVVGAGGALSVLL